MGINKFVFLTKTGFDYLYRNNKLSGKVIVIEGGEIQSKQELFNVISERLELPEIISSWSIFDDYLRSYSFFNDVDTINLVFLNFNDMLYSDRATKLDLVESFTECILPFWESEVVYTVVDGQTRKFDVYAINGEY